MTKATLLKYLDSYSRKISVLVGCVGMLGMGLFIGVLLSGSGWDAEAGIVGYVLVFCSAGYGAFFFGVHGWLAMRSSRHGPPRSPTP